MPSKYHLTNFILSIIQMSTLNKKRTMVIMARELQHAKLMMELTDSYFSWQDGMWPQIHPNEDMSVYPHYEEEQQNMAIIAKVERLNAAIANWQTMSKL